jgi:tRNA(adenine34) deaminase
MNNRSDSSATGVAPKLNSSLFFAVVPDLPATSRVATLAAQLCAEHALSGTPIAAERLHVTLYHLGKYPALPPDILARAREAAQLVSIAPFEVVFDRVMSFPGRPGQQPLVLRGGSGVDALIELQRGLAAALHTVGLAARAKQHFTPHVTLSYDEQRLGERSIDSIRWQVNEFALLESLLGQSTYLRRDTWPLQQAAASAEDLHYMSRALELARLAQAAGEVPVGAVIVKGSEIIGEGWNRPIGTHDPTAHAEIVALRQAAQTMGSYRLSDATLYVTLEPCSMCAGAMVHSRVQRLVYGATDPQAGAAGSAFNIVQSGALNHRLQCTAGVMAEQCSTQLREFFRARR